MREEDVYTSLGKEQGPQYLIGKNIVPASWLVLDMAFFSFNAGQRRRRERTNYKPTHIQGARQYGYGGVQAGREQSWFN